MVEYERHRNTLYTDSYNYKNDSYNYKNDFSVERYRPYRSSRNYDELKYSHKLNESNYRDNIYSSRSRSRSRSTSRSRSRSRERYAKEKYSRYERSKERHFKLSNKSKLYYSNEVISRSSIRYDKSNYDYERTSKSPSRRNERYFKKGHKLKSENVNFKNMYDKDFVERSFSIKRTSPRNDKENKPEYGKSKLIVIGNCNDPKSHSKKSLLGNGPENLRIYPSESEKSENHRIMCEETVLLMNSQCKTSPSSEKIDEYISNKLTNSILAVSHLENAGTDNTVIDAQIIDYNHEDIFNETPVSLNSENTLLKSDSYIKEEAPSLMPSFHEFDSNSYDNENVLKINEHIDNQIKSLAELLTTPVEKEIKWNLIPLFAPIRKRISEKDIDIKSCSEYDPRIAHIVQNLF